MVRAGRTGFGHNIARDESVRETRRHEDIVGARVILQRRGLESRRVFRESHVEVVGACEVEEGLCQVQRRCGEKVRIAVLVPEGVVPVEIT